MSNPNKNEWANNWLTAIMVILVAQFAATIALLAVCTIILGNILQFSELVDEILRTWG